MFDAQADTLCYREAALQCVVNYSLWRKRIKKVLTTNNETRGNEKNWRDIPGLVHSVETCGTVDGPGIRFIVFLSGCSLRCCYCHNPDTSFVRRGKTRTAGEVVDEIAAYASFLKNAGGGVTLSGGDPLFQADFTAAILSGCKELGLHTTMDTAGALGNLATDAMLADTDLVLLDIKAGTPEIYKKTTCGNLEATLNFARRLHALGKKAWLRYVLVPGLTDAEASIRGVASFARDVPIFERVDVLPFHKLGAFKWKELGLKDPLENTSEPRAEQVAHAKSVFAEYGFTNIY